MNFLKKDLGFILKTKSKTIIISIIIGLLMKNLYSGTNLLSDVYLSNNNITYIELMKNKFSIANYVFLFLMIGQSIPKKLFEIEDEVMDYLLLTPQNNTHILYSKIFSSIIIMLPLIILNMIIFKHYNLNIFLITFFIGIITILVTSITSFIKIKYVKNIIIVINSIIVIFIAFIKNPIVDYINKTIYNYSFSNKIPAIFLFELLIIIVILSILVIKLYKIELMRRKY